MAQTPDVTGREILPIPDLPVKGKMALDARDAEFPPIEPLRPPQGAPGNDSIRPNTVATIAEMLRLNGYSTGCVGKAHQTPTWEVSMSGPFDRRPTGEGFEKFYGFVGGETNQSHKCRFFTIAFWWR